MDTSNVMFSVTDLRHQTSRVLKQAEERGYVYLLRRSKVQAALVAAGYLSALQEAYEDYLDTSEYDKTIKLKRIPLAKHQKAYTKSRQT